MLHDDSNWARAALPGDDSNWARGAVRGDEAGVAHQRGVHPSGQQLAGREEADALHSSGQVAPELRHAPRAGKAAAERSRS